MIALGQNIQAQFVWARGVALAQAKEDREMAVKAAGRSPPQKRGEREEAVNPLTEAMIPGKDTCNLTVEFRDAIGVDKAHASDVGLKVRQNLTAAEIEQIELIMKEPAGGPLDKARIVGPGMTAGEKLYEFMGKVAGLYLEAKYNVVLDKEKMFKDMGGCIGSAHSLAKYQRTAVVEVPRPTRLIAAAGIPAVAAAEAPAVAGATTVPVARVVPPIRAGICLTCGLKHATAECQMDVATLQCMTCKQMGHATGICPSRRY